MKKIMMIVALAVATLTASAQREVGTLSLQPKVGLTLTSITNNTWSINDETMDKSLKPGFLVGVELEYQFAPKASIAAAAVYSQQGVKWGDYSTILTSSMGSYSYSIKDRMYDMGYINIPIVVNYYIANNFAIKAGIQPGFLTSSKFKVTENTNGTEVKTDQDNKSELKSFDFSIPVGLSYEFSNVVLDARYNFGLTKVNKEGDKSCKNSVFQLTVGYKFDL